MLIGKNKDNIVVIVFDTAKPMNIVPVKSVGNFRIFEIKMPKTIKIKEDKIHEKRRAIILFYVW